MVELEIYALGEPTGTEITIDPASVQAVEGLPGNPRASKVVFKDEKYCFCVSYPDEVRAKLGKK